MSLDQEQCLYARSDCICLNGTDYCGLYGPFVCIYPWWVFTLVHTQLYVFLDTPSELDLGTRLLHLICILQGGVFSLSRVLGPDKLLGEATYSDWGSRYPSYR